MRMSSRTRRGNKMDEKKTYSTPLLMVYGNVENLTESKPYVGIDDSSWNSRSRNKGSKNPPSGI